MLTLLTRLFKRAPRPTFKHSQDDSLYKNLPREFSRAHTGQIIIKHPNGTKEYFTKLQLNWLSREPRVKEAKRKVYAAALQWAEANPEPAE